MLILFFYLELILSVLFSIELQAIWSILLNPFMHDVEKWLNKYVWLVFNIKHERVNLKFPKKPNHIFINL